jgi:hypothetical protein
MLSAHKFEKVNGHVPTTVKNGGGWLATCECACDGMTTLLVGDGSTEAGALATLLHHVYRHHGFIVMTKQNWACLECSRVVALQCDHLKPRSKGRDDRITNLAGKCCSCHSLKHGG